MLDFLKKLFSSTYPLGALKSPQDNRTINTVAVQPPVSLPDDFNSNTSPVDFQILPDCVAEAITGVKEDFLLDGRNFVALAAEDLYYQCKAQDGVPDQPGTYPLIGAKIAVASGIASRSVYDSGDRLAIQADRSKYKLGGFMSVGTTYDQVCQAIFQNKRITASFSVDNNWFIGLITRVLQSIGRHYTKLHGFYRPKIIIRGQNTWGIKWVGNIAGWIDPSVAPGHFNVYWPDVSDSVTDIFAFTDSIPTPVLDHVKSLNYHFGLPMKIGDQSFEVMQLQKRLLQEGFWSPSQSCTGYYGSITAAHVLDYQKNKNIVKDGSESNYGQLCGPKTLRMLNGEVGLAEIPAQIQVESQGNDYAVGDLTLTNHAYGCLQIRQGICDDLNARFGTKYMAKDMIGNRQLSLEVRSKYFSELYTHFDTWQKRAMAWNGGPGYAVMYEKPGYENYTRSLDAYVAKMAALMA